MNRVRHSVHSSVVVSNDENGDDDDDDDDGITPSDVGGD